MIAKTSETSLALMKLLSVYLMNSQSVVMTKGHLRQLHRAFDLVKVFLACSSSFLP